MLENKELRGVERRRKRLLLPIIYLVSEVVLTWLVLVLIQLKFDIREWSVWAIAVLLIVSMYSVLKTVHVYQRQKEYVASKEKNKKVKI